MVFRRDREIPYGPYLSLATLILLLGWKHIWPAAERFFSLGLFVPAMGVVMCVLLFLSLQTMQWTKRLLGIPDYEPEDDGPNLAIGRPALPLLRRQRRPSTDPLARTQWPGVGACRGSLFEQRWRDGHVGK